MNKLWKCLLLLALFGVAAARGRPRPDVSPAQAASAAVRPIEFSEHLIADGYAYPHGIAAVDIDLDGDLDLTSADYQDRKSVV